MSYHLVFHRRPGYLHAVVTGDNTRENVIAYLHEVHLECIESDVHRVLIEERLAGPRLPLMDVFDIASEARNRAVGRLPTIAYVDVHADDATRVAFAEDVAANRGVRVRAFASVDEARQWLHSLVAGRARSDARAEREQQRSR